MPAPHSASGGADRSDPSASAGSPSLGTRGDPRDGSRSMPTPVRTGRDRRAADL